VIKSFKKPLLAIIITHAHPDHFGGLEQIATVFPQVPIYSSLETKVDIATDKNGYIRSTKLFIGSDFGNNVPIPAKTIDSVLNLGSLQLLFDTYRNGESESLNTFQIKSTDIVFASDLINNKMIPYLVEGHTANWLKHLDQFTQKYPPHSIVYPGHGAHGSIEELTAFQKEYITTIRNLVSLELQEKKNLNSESKKRIIKELNSKFGNLDGVTPSNSLNAMNVDAVEDELKKEKSNKNKMQ
jgi:glyoxylase-like metal-dependent hydrolase (beta-lactamase superfamily II)